MSIKTWLLRLWHGPAPQSPPPERARLTPDPGPRYGGIKIHSEALELAAAKPAGKQRAQEFAALFPVAKAPPGVPDTAEIAMDDAMQANYGYADAGWFGEGIAWLGFPYLAELTQRPEYRLITETRAKEMTRKGFELTYSGKDKAGRKKLLDLEAACKKHRVVSLLRKAAEQEGYYGRGQIYLDTGATDDRAELQKPLLIDKAKIPKGGELAFRLVEPMWSYPNMYNSLDPLKLGFYRPDSWFVMNKIVNTTRMLTFISREVPDILKPAYSFAGMSMTQIAKPYVDNWLRTRQSVSDIIHSFSVMVLLTNLQGALQGTGGGSQGSWGGIFDRIDVMNVTRDNRGTLVLDKDTEEFQNIAAPITGLSDLQGQSQEQMCSISQTPAVKLLGIQPAGLNASSDGEIRVFYDNIAALQEHMFTDNLKVMLDCIQLNEFGMIDPEISFKFVPLWQLDEVAQAGVRKTEADTDAVYIQEGVIDPDEVRERIGGDDESPYHGLEGPAPGPPDMGDEDDLSAVGSITGNASKGAEPKKEQRSGV